MSDVPAALRWFVAGFAAAILLCEVRDWRLELRREWARARVARSMSRIEEMAAKERKK